MDESNDIEERRQQLAVEMFRAIEEEHDGVLYVEVSRSWPTDASGVESEDEECRISASSSCKCRMMCSDPDRYEMDEHRDVLRGEVYRFLSSLPAGLMTNLFGRVEKIRFYTWPTVRCAVAPFPPEDDRYGFVGDSD